MCIRDRVHILARADAQVNLDRRQRSRRSAGFAQRAAGEHRDASILCPQLQGIHDHVDAVRIDFDISLQRFHDQSAVQNEQFANLNVAHCGKVGLPDVHLSDAPVRLQLVRRQAAARTEAGQTLSLIHI